MMEHAVDNLLLAKLPPADLALLAPQLRKVVMQGDSVLVRSGDRIEHLFFPLSGAIAANGVAERADRRHCDHRAQGAVGLTSSLVASASPATAVVRIPGTALQISRAHFWQRNIAALQSHPWCGSSRYRC